MKLPPLPHEYLFPIPEATKIQNEIAQQVQLTEYKGPIKTIAAVDVSSAWHGHTLYAAVILLSYPNLEIIQECYAVHETKFPYVPGYLSFREIPALFKAFEQLHTKPDILMVDGQGITHPRHVGIAAHLGVLLDIPSIGIAKSKLYGEYEEPKTTSPIYDPKTKEILGTAFVSKKGCKPIIVSPGHLVTVEQALEIVQTTIRGRRIPLPTLLAHEKVNAFRRTTL